MSARPYFTLKVSTFGIFSLLLCRSFNNPQMNDSKIINDPIFGFIKIPNGLLLDIVEHPLMQRLTRIKQLGLTSMVYPSAQHTRFQHSIGAFHLMSEAITSLTQKGIFIFDSEEEAVEAAILMHDIGHGPFSHVLEHSLISGISSIMTICAWPNSIIWIRKL